MESAKWESMKPTVCMVMLQMTIAGLNVLYKLAMDAGMSMHVLVAYRFMFGTAFLCPLAFFMERHGARCKISWMVLSQSFLSGLFGDHAITAGATLRLGGSQVSSNLLKNPLLATLAQNFYIASMKLTSATYVCAMANLLPAVTFILAVLFRLERLAIGTLSGQAKVLGTAIGIGGAMLLTFYKGPQVQFWSVHMHLLHHRLNSTAHQSGNLPLGSVLAMGSNFSAAIWLIIQAKICERFPYPYSSTALMCLMAALQSTCIALVTEKDPTAWKLGWDIKLFTVLYAGVLLSGLMLSVMSWCIQKKGPLFVSIFNPLMLIMVAFLGSIFLDEILHLGSVLGGALIVVGLYVVLWGKSKEMQKLVKLPSRKLSLLHAPSVSDGGSEGPQPPVAEKSGDFEDEETTKSLEAELV